LTPRLPNRRAARRALQVAALTLGAGLLAGCALLRDPPQTAALHSQPPLDLPAVVERAEVPFFPQTAHHCGPAALATVLTHAGLPADPLALADAVFLPGRQGSLQIEMLAATRRHGALALRLPAALPALLQTVAEGHPVVVLQNLGLAALPRWHYAVVVGYDLPAGQVLLRSGTTERQVLSLRTFEHTWARGGHWAFVALLPGQLPRVATQAASVDAVLGFARTAAPGPLAAAWAPVHARWPAAEVPAVALAGALHAGGDDAAAAAVLQAALRHQDSATLWNNLARLHLALGNLDAAAHAAGQAVARAAAAQPQWLQAATETQAAVRAAHRPTPAQTPQQATQDRPADAVR
jgi:hypothetical protein